MERAEWLGQDAFFSKKKGRGKDKGYTKRGADLPHGKLSTGLFDNRERRKGG